MEFGVFMIFWCMAITVFFLLVFRRLDQRLEKTRQFIGEINKSLLDLQIRVSQSSVESSKMLQEKLEELKEDISQISYSNRSTRSLQKQLEKTFESLEKYYGLVQNDINNLRMYVNKFDNLLTEDNHKKIVRFPVKKGVEDVK